MLQLRKILLGAGLVALVAGLSVASIYAEVRTQPLGLIAPSQIDSLNLMIQAPAQLPVQTADAI